MKQTIYFLTGFVAAGLGVFLVMLMLVGSVREEASELRGELDGARAQVADLESEQLVVYCRGVIDQFLGGINDPEVISRNDQSCLEIMRVGIPPGFRGP